MNRFLKISLLCLGLEMGTMPGLQAREDIFGNGSEDVCWNAITDAFDQAFGQDANDLGLASFSTIPFLMECLFIEMWQPWHGKTISRTANAAEAYKNIVKGAGEAGDNNPWFHENLGAHILIVNTLSALQAQPELWNKVLTLIELIDQEFLALLQAQKIISQEDIDAYEPEDLDDYINLFKEDFWILLQKAIDTYQQEYLEILKSAFKNSDKNSEQIFNGLSFNADIAALAQAPDWYDNLIEQYMKQNDVKDELYPVLHTIFAYIKDCRIEQILDVYRNLSEEDKAVYKEQLNIEISGFIRASILLGTIPAKALLF